MSNLKNTFPLHPYIVAEQKERQRCLDILTLTPSEIRLMAGELTAQEMRTVQAVLNGLKRKIQNV